MEEAHASTSIVVGSERESFVGRREECLELTVYGRIADDLERAPHPLLVHTEQDQSHALMLALCACRADPDPEPIRIQASKAKRFKSSPSHYTLNQLH